MQTTETALHHPETPSNSIQETQQALEILTTCILDVV